MEKKRKEKRKWKELISEFYDFHSPFSEKANNNINKFMERKKREKLK